MGLETYPDMACSVGLDGTVRDVNAALAEALGFDRDELIARPAAELVHPDDLELSQRALQQLLREGRLTGVQHRCRSKQGGWRWLEWSARVAPDTGLVYATARDVTARHRAEALTEHTHSAVRLGGWRLDLRTDELTWTRETYRLHETSPEEYRPQVSTALGFYAPESVPVISAALERARSLGEPYDLELDVVTARGRRIRVRSVVEVEWDAGRPSVAFGTFQDITAQKRVEEHLRRFEAIVRATTDFIGIAAVQTEEVRFVNKAGRELVGLSEDDDISHEHISDFHSPEQYDAIVRDALPTVIEKGAWSGETMLRHRIDGHEIPVSQIIVPLDDELGEPLVATVMRDLRERRELEHQLLHSQKMEGIGRLAGGIALDFNNILTAILAHVEILKRHALEPAVHKGVDAIHQAADRAAALTAQLLAFARKQIAQPQVVDLRESVREVHELLRHTLGEDIELVTRMDEAPCAVLIDPNQLEQVIVNLAVNARDAMPAGGGLVLEVTSVTLAPLQAAAREGLMPGAYVQLAVSDTGSGIPPEILDQIFEPFFTTKERGRGTGLGLATCDGIVSQNGGAIFVDSSPGGTRFEILLPAARGPIQVDSGPPPTGSLEGDEVILAVEDEDVLREIIVTELERRGYTVLSAATGPEALRLADAHSGTIDLLVTDVVMPLMGGRELSEQLTRTRPEVQTLFASGYADYEIAQHGSIEPETHFLPKPFTPHQLASAVRRLLDHPVARTQS